MYIYIRNLDYNNNFVYVVYVMEINVMTQI